MAREGKHRRAEGTKANQLAFVNSSTFAFQWGRAPKQEATTAKHHARRSHIHISSGVAFSARLYLRGRNCHIIPCDGVLKELIQRSSFICFGPENPEFIA
jgi:hypothetical protein